MEAFVTSRRSVLRIGGSALVIWAVTACARTIGTGIRAAIDTARFPLGVASADPDSTSVMLWTSVRPDSPSQPVTVRVEVSRDPAFADIVAATDVTAEPARDHSVAIVVNGLQADSYHYYRFIDANGRASRTGRTRTAPDPKSDAPARFAFFSCQNYNHGFFTAYRHLIDTDSAAAEADRVHFCLHLGDFIYETTGLFEFDREGRPLDLRDAGGRPRRIPPFPTGRDLGKGVMMAADLADYRHLYRTYLTDPDLQEARALFPFVSIWDDHEFANDCWQSYAGVGPLQKGKVAAAQAWCEYVPARLDGDGPARDFRPTKVENRPPGPFDDHYLSMEPNNLAAIDAVCAYRNLRWGKMVDLVITDMRSYRSPSGAPDILFEQQGVSIRSALSTVPVDAVAVFAAGRTAAGGVPPAQVTVGDRMVPNVHRDMPPVTILGERQKAWFRDTILASDARWRIWANSVPMMPLVLDMSALGDGHHDGVVWTDCWDGYPNEREELLRFFRQHGIDNLLSISGDRHAHFAGTVPLVENGKAVSVCAEFACTGVSAATRTKILGWQTRHDPLLSALVKRNGRTVLDTTLTAGVAAALGRTPAPRSPNPHLVHAETSAYGYAVITLSAERADVAMHTLPEPLDDPRLIPALPIHTNRFAVLGGDADVQVVSG